MLFGILSDIRGNLPALETVLAAIDDEGIQLILNLGNCVVGHPWSNDVVNLLWRREIPSVQGELDRATVQCERKKGLGLKLPPEHLERIRSAYEELSCENIEYLRSLPRRIETMAEGLRVVAFHGAPRGVSETLGPEDNPDRFRRVRELTQADIVAYGGLPEPFEYLIDGCLFVCPGTVTVETGGSVARYAVINTETAPWHADFRQIEY